MLPRQLRVKKRVKRSYSEGAREGGREGGGSSTPRSSQGGETNRGKEGDREALPPTPRHSQEGEVKSIILRAGWKCCPRTCFKKKKVVAFPRITSIADLILDFLIRFFPPPLPAASSRPSTARRLLVSAHCVRGFSSLLSDPANGVSR